ncbi:SDR family oxidoreductase [bacterium]|nr:SDR family oxidoreductase [bacterium]
MHILVTGNLGFIGSLAVEMLKERGDHVTGLDIGYYTGCDFATLTEPDVQLIRDIRNVKVEDLDGIDAVFHFAALSNDPTGELNPELTQAINFRASVDLAGLAKRAGIDRFVFSSSCSLYGKAEGDRPKTEDDAMNPLTVYAKSKVWSEEAITQLADENFCPIFMRNATAYGISPRLRLDLVLNNLTAVAFATQEVRIMSDGTPWRPIIHARDIVNAYCAVLEAPREVVFNRKFNVGVNAENYQVRAIADMVQSVLKNCNVVFTQEHGTDTRSYRVAFDKFHQAVPGFEAQWTAMQGIEELCRAFKEKSFSHADFLSRKYTRLKQIEYLIQNRIFDENLARMETDAC